MKIRKKGVLYLLLPLLCVALIMSCKKGDDDAAGSSQAKASFQEVEFSVANPIDESSNARTGNATIISKASITITNSDGSSTAYTEHIMDVYTLNDQLITKKIVLPVGDYVITSFGLIDENNEITHATPRKGTDEAQLVGEDAALDVSFTVGNNAISTINMGVVEIFAGSDPDDFGFTSLQPNVVEVIDFLVHVSEFATDNALEAEVTVTYDVDTVTVNTPDFASYIRVAYQETDDYTITVTVPGYETHTETLTYAELNEYDNGVKVYVVELFPNGDETTSAEVSTLAGDGFSQPFMGIAALGVDNSGNTYVEDIVDNQVMKVTPGGAVSTLVSGENGELSDIAVDESGNIFVADLNYRVIRKITPIGQSTIYAGVEVGGPEYDAIDASDDPETGNKTAVIFYNISGLEIDSEGNLYVTDNSLVKKVGTDEMVSIFAGDYEVGGGDDFGGGGSGEEFFRTGAVNNTSTDLLMIRAITIDRYDNVYVLDGEFVNSFVGSFNLKKITSNGVITTIVDGNGNALMEGLTGITIDDEGTIYATNKSANKIIKITQAGVVSSFAGNGTSAYVDGPAATASFTSLEAIEYDASTNSLIVADGHKIRKVELD